MFSFFVRLILEYFIVVFCFMLYFFFHLFHAILKEGFWLSHFDLWARRTGELSYQF